MIDIDQKQKENGPFSLQAEMSRRIKGTMQCSEHWNSLTYCQQEALDMIAHKIGRILAGNANNKDHWDDISGYAQIASDSEVE